MEIEVKETITRKINVEFPALKKTENGIYRIDSETEGKAIHLWTKGEMQIETNLLSYKIKEVLSEGKDATEEDWRNAVLEVKIRADKYFHENFISSREDVELL